MSRVLAKAGTIRSLCRAAAHQRSSTVDDRVSVGAVHGHDPVEVVEPEVALTWLPTSRLPPNRA
jgi:hypothetical protein